MPNLVVHFSGERGTDFAWASQFQNFAEDVFYWMRSNGFGVVELHEVDRGAPHFTITGVVASKRRRVIQWIEEEALRHRQPVTIELR